MRPKKFLSTLLLGVLIITVLAGCGGQAVVPVTSVDWNTMKSAEEGGGMDALVAAAKAEGELNVITRPRDWCNYGEAGFDIFILRQRHGSSQFEEKRFVQFLNIGKNF